MKIELREDSVFISGYVNAIERYSKPIIDTLYGRQRKFVEKVKTGVFKRALEKNDNVLVLLNHDYNKQIANTSNHSAKLYEDNIGLRAEVTITDSDVIEKAKNNKLVGWSFGFAVNSDEIGKENGSETRTLTDIDLIEVSLLDDTKSPAYYGTSVETRTTNGKKVEIRVNEEMPEVKELNYEELAKLIADIVIERLNAKENAEEIKDAQEDIQEAEKEIVENQEDRAIDYSSFEERLNKLGV